MNLTTTHQFHTNIQLWYVYMYVYIFWRGLHFFFFTPGHPTPNFHTSNFNWLCKKKLHPTYEFRQIFIVFPFIQCVYTKKIQQRFAGMTNIRTKKINILTLNQSLFNTYIFVRSVICFAYERPIESQSAVNSTLDLLLLKLFVVDLWFLFPCCFFWLKR